MTINPSQSETFPVLKANDWRDYSLIDSGDGMKLESFGEYSFIRPDSMAMWQPNKDTQTWKADAIFSGAEGEEMGRWNFRKIIPDKWPLSWGEIKFYARCTPFRHLGFFPEQSVHWRYCKEKIEIAKAKNRDFTPNILNLFGYTGLASLVCAKAGAKVTHVDASKKAIGFAKENQTLSNLDDAPIRWIIDDAMKFIAREIRRGNKYHGIILDPPKHGRGPNGEIFKLEEQLLPLLNACAELLEKEPLFMVATVYAVRLSHLALRNVMTDALMQHHIVTKNLVESGEMALVSKTCERLLPTAIYARL